MSELDIEEIRERLTGDRKDLEALLDEVERLRAERENTPSDTTGGHVIRLSAGTVKELEAGMLEIRIHRDANLGGIVIDTERETPAWWHR
ncbi:hypothetical protein [Propionibacterium freudenreichii]|uniref:hypothetical protein n=1 Tax=Propionibacterium freudenreichii TaxID=1744 RepID=UPI00054401CA|nr:hypothetical protein [Propionibacterium freudenreichii]CEG97732.1 Protein of unknown function [Propionibacterium freudenreichii]